MANTTTESANVESSGTVLRGDEDPSSQFSPENDLNLEGLAVTFPSDQIRMIQNINTLIVEVSSFTWIASCYLRSVVLVPTLTCSLTAVVIGER